MRVNGETPDDAQFPAKRRPAVLAPLRRSRLVRGPDDGGAATECAPAARALRYAASSHRPDDAPPLRLAFLLSAFSGRHVCHASRPSLQQQQQQQQLCSVIFVHLLALAFSACLACDRTLQVDRFVYFFIFFLLFYFHHFCFLSFRLRRFARKREINNNPNSIPN